MKMINMKGRRRRSKREVKIFGKNEMIYDQLEEIQQIAVDERGYSPLDGRTCDVHEYERHVTHFYNENKSLRERLQTISVQERYCFLCGHYEWTACICHGSTACEDTPKVSLSEI